MAPDLSPDPDQGVFETLLVLDGVAVELEPHLARLGASLASLYGAELPAQAGEALAQRAAGLTLGRVRLTVAPGAARLAWEAVGAEIDPSVPFPEPEHGAELTSHVLPGGLGRHKWADRSALPPSGGGTVPLLLDRGGEVLETARANVFAVVAGQLATPPDDGRILPGIARAATVELARAEGIELVERPLRLDDLLAAEEVFLTNSVRGIEPVRTLDASPRKAEHRVGRRLAALLRERWAAERRAVPARSA
jgi:para-aminobenzoate synthetase / 4-amino-4-deoxychorismate lyase